MVNYKTHTPITSGLLKDSWLRFLFIWTIKKTQSVIKLIESQYKQFYDYDDDNFIKSNLKNNVLKTM